MNGRAVLNNFMFKGELCSYRQHGAAKLAELHRQWVRACVRACVRTCVWTCAWTCVRTCVRTCVGGVGSLF